MIGLWWPLCAAAQQYPTHPIRMLVPSTPGGSVDTLARAVAPRLAERFKQQVVVDNRAGAGGVIAGELTARAAPDGYTLMMGTIASLATNMSLQKNLLYDSVRDFAPVTLVATQNLVLVLHPSVPAKSVAELVALSKSGRVTFASAGNGTGGHLSGELFKMLTGAPMQHIPYKGIAPAMVDVMSGQVTLSFASIASGMPHVRSGKLRALAVSGAKRSAAAAELPTLQEADVKGYESATWYDIVAKLHQETVAILKQPGVHERIAADGAEPVGNTPDEFGRFLRAEITKWAQVIKAAGLRNE